MTNEENRPDSTQQQTPSNLPPRDPENSPTGSQTPIEQFKEIKQALIGTEPEWILPCVNPKASASKP